MKTTIYYTVLLLALIALFSCEKAVDTDLLANSENVEETHAVIPSDADSLGAISFMPETEEMKILRERLKELNKKLFRSARSYNYDSDPNFYSNMMAIRELPIYFKVRNQDLYLSSNGRGKEISLSSINNIVLDKHFYLKMFAPSTGIPYMIYANKPGTPIAVGQYDNNPNDKLVFAMNSDVNQGSSLFNATWDLIPSQENKGYFAIESQTYLGKSDPNDMWSVFKYVIEVKPDYKLGYAQYTKKAEQEFLIIPFYKFKLDHIEFHTETQKVNRLSPLKVISHGTNDTEEKRNITIYKTHYTDDKSRFSENSILRIPINNPNDLFYRPKVSAMRLVVPSPVNPNDEPNKDSFEKDMQYSLTQQNIRKSLSLEINLTDACPNSLIEVISYLETHSVSVEYTAYMSCTKPGETQPRIIKINGTWSGVITTTKRDSRYPIDVAKYWDLDDGEEITCK